jgi:serine/threonine protein kinase
MTQNRLSTASDVYSYAIIMYEMLTWQMPFHDLSKEQVKFWGAAAAAAERANNSKML